VTSDEPVPEPATDDDVIWQVERKQSADVGGRWVTTEFTKTAPNAPDEGFPPQRLTAYVPAARLAALQAELDRAREDARLSDEGFGLLEEGAADLLAERNEARAEIGRLTVRGRQEAAISDVMRDRALTAERRVARVQALCDDPGALYYGEDGELSALLANDVRAALDGTQ
jgi:hypothetical protein